MNDIAVWTITTKDPVLLIIETPSECLEQQGIVPY
jgi:hypothetical protein